MKLALILGSGTAMTLLAWHPGAWPIYACLSIYFLCAALGAGCWEYKRLVPGVPLLVLISLGIGQILFDVTVSTKATIEATLIVGGWAAAFLAGTHEFRTESARRGLLNVLGALAGVIAIAAILMPTAGRLGIPGVISMASDYMAGPFPNRNIYACFAELALPVTVWLAVRSGNAVWWIASAAVVSSVLAAGTRGGAAIILTEVLILALSAGSRTAAVILGGTAAATLAAAGATLMTRLSYENPWEFRSEMAQSAWRLALERPLAGWGLGSFSQAYPQFATFDTGGVVNHAHNDWFEWAAEAGIPAAVAMAAFFVVSLRGVRTHWWGLGVAAVCVHAAIDYPLHRQGVAVWMILLAAALTAARQSGTPMPPSPTRLRVRR